MTDPTAKTTTRISKGLLPELIHYRGLGTMRITHNILEMIRLFRFPQTLRFLFQNRITLASDWSISKQTLSFLFLFLFSIRSLANKLSLLRSLLIPPPPTPATLGILIVIFLGIWRVELYFINLFLNSPARTLSLSLVLGLVPDGIAVVEPDEVLVGEA